MTRWLFSLQDEPEAQSEHEEVELKVKKPKKSPKKSSKYDRAAEKSLSVSQSLAVIALQTLGLTDEAFSHSQNFLGMVAGDLLGGDEDDEDDEDDSAMDSASASGNGGGSNRSGSASVQDIVDGYLSSDPGSAEVELKGKTPKGKKRPSSSTVDKSKKHAPKKRKKASPKGGKENFKSKETISDSDDSGDASGSTRKASGSAGQSGGESSGEEDQEVEVKGGLKGKGKSKEKGPRKSKERKLKEGDEPRGTEQEEDRIRQLKALLVLAGVLRPFSRTTGAERTLTVSARLDRLEGLLVELGLPCGKGVGTKMPSEAKAREVGTARALEQEVKVRL